MIGLGVGDLVNGGAKVTLTDPVGLYIQRCDLAGLRGPKGEAVGNDAVVVVRGTEDAAEPRIVRFKVEVPAKYGVALGECSLGQRPLQRGGQVARLTAMALYAQTYPGRADKSSKSCDGMACRNPSHVNLFAAGALSGCPAADDLAWLLETPALSTSGNEMFASKLSSKLVERVSAVLRVDLDPVGEVVAGPSAEPRPLSRSPPR